MYGRNKTIGFIATFVSLFNDEYVIHKSFEIFIYKIIREVIFQEYTFSNSNSV